MIWFDYNQLVFNKREWNNCLKISKSWRIVITNFTLPLFSLFASSLFVTGFCFQFGHFPTHGWCHVKYNKLYLRRQLRFAFASNQISDIINNIKINFYMVSVSRHFDIFAFYSNSSGRSKGLCLQCNSSYNFAPSTVLLPFHFFYI